MVLIMNDLSSYLTSFSLQTLVALYFITNTFRIVSYGPQILQVARQNDDVKAISLWTWGMWTASNLTTALYAAFILPKFDLLLVLLNLGNTAGCLMVILLVISKRKAYSDRMNFQNSVTNTLTKNTENAASNGASGVLSPTIM